MDLRARADTRHLRRARRRRDARNRRDQAAGPACGLGYWAAFWLLGASGWPQNGEIDIMEDVNADSELSGTAHVAIGGGYPDAICSCVGPTAQTTSGGTMSVRGVAVYDSAPAGSGPFPPRSGW